MSDQGSYRKKLIEVALPLDAINKEAAREKSIRHGHPSTLHLWWARRPLAACRAVLFGQLVDDPSSRPEEFPTEEAQDAERQRLFGIIERLVKWENSNNEAVLEEARAEIRKSCDGDPPPILDPFAGGGSIPLEAQRLGLEAHASDLNPVAVLICKALIEIPPKWAGRPPVHPADDRFPTDGAWERAQGLAEDVRYYGQWMRDEAERRIGHLYPKATLPDGSQANVIAWIWARTVTCPNPACGAAMPLVRSFWLGKKKGKEAWARPVVEGNTVRFEIGEGPSGPPIEGTVSRSGATCIVCETPVPFKHVRAEGQAGRMNQQLMAVVAEGDRRRVYLPPTDEHAKAADVDRPDDSPESDLPEKALGFRVQQYGMTRHADLFTNRQLVALTIFSDLVTEARDRIATDAHTAGLDEDEAREYASAVTTYLAFSASKLADRNSTVVSWASNREHVRNTFARQALPMTWDYSEVDPLGTASGSFSSGLATLAEAVSEFPATPEQVDVQQADARLINSDTPVIVTTDPPYYDNIGYADLSDYFYVWLRRSLRQEYGGLFRVLLVPKSEELVASPYRFGGSRQRADDHFEAGFVDTFNRFCSIESRAFPLAFFYAFKQAEQSPDGEGIASTGWVTMLEGLLAAGLLVTGTWPMRTEVARRFVAAGTNALASSVVLVCRPRAETAGVTDRRGFVNAMKSELPGELKHMQEAAIAPVDLAQAAIGPGMAVFSRYSKVIEPSGDAMSVRTALGLINQVLAEVLDEQEGEFDADTQWAIKWFDQYGFDEGSFGEANQLANAMGIAVDGLAHAGIVESGRGKVSLLALEDYPDGWGPVEDDQIPVWEATHHLAKRLTEHGEEAAGDLLARLGGLGDSCQQLAYRLYSLCERKRPALAGPYNALGASWADLLRHAAASSERIAEQQTLS